MPLKSNLYGLVVCGGNSTRMGIDKGMLIYHKKLQRYHIYEIMENICCKVFISCSLVQAMGIDNHYRTLVDLPEYENTGPMAALLTAFKKYPLNNFLSIACDYPFIMERDIKEFLTFLKENETGAFYNEEERLYEPLLALYSHKDANNLLSLYKEKRNSLQYFLKINNGVKYIPADKRTIQSADTPEDYIAAMNFFEKQKKYLTL